MSGSPNNGTTEIPTDNNNIHGGGDYVGSQSSMIAALLLAVDALKAQVAAVAALASLAGQDVEQVALIQQQVALLQP